MIKQLIKQAKDKYPISIRYKGRIAENEMVELKKICDVRCPSVYMDGSVMYSIRYWGDKYSR